MARPEFTCSVQVQPLPEQTNPAAGQYAWAYTITIQNTGDNEIVVKTGTLTLSSDHSFNLAVTGTQNGISNDHLAALAGTWAETDTGVRFSAVGVPLAINASRTSVANQLVFVVPGQTFSSSQAGVTVVFTK